MGDATRHTLGDWLWAYFASVILAHSLINIGIIAWWPLDAPLRVWDVVLGISASAIVALVAGAITIAISWRTSQHFGDESNAVFAAELRQALASSVATADEAGAALLSLLRAAQDDRDGLLILALSPTALARLTDADRAGVLNILESRYTDDLPAVLAVPIPGWVAESDGQPTLSSSDDAASAALWKVLGRVAESPAFSSRFVSRRSIIIPHLSGTEAIALYLRQSGTASYQPDSCFWAQPGESDWLGVRSSIDEQFARVLIDRLYRTIQEPAATYGRRLLMSTDILAGQLTGIPVTRSIITSQLLIGIGRRLTIAPGPCGTRSVLATAPADTGPRLEFGYAPDLFLPPLASNDNHSGASIGRLLGSAEVPLAGKRVWEVGCGPGYLTRVLANGCIGGSVLAVDVSAHALDVARENVSRSRSPNAAPVTYVQGDCLSFTMEATSEGSRSVLAIAPPNSKELIPIDLVIIELPLLGYAGRRPLTVFEAPYLESLDIDADSLLPPTMEKLLKALASVLPGTDSEVLVPACAASPAEREQVQRHLERLVGGDIVVDHVTKHSGFIQSFLLRRRR